MQMRTKEYKNSNGLVKTTSLQDDPGGEGWGSGEGTGVGGWGWGEGGG